MKQFPYAFKSALGFSIWSYIIWQEQLTKESKKTAPNWSHFSIRTTLCPICCHDFDTKESWMDHDRKQEGVNKTTQSRFWICGDINIPKSSNTINSNTWHFVSKLTKNTQLSPCTNTHFSDQWQMQAALAGWETEQLLCPEPLKARLSRAGSGPTLCWFAAVSPMTPSPRNGSHCSLPSTSGLPSYWAQVKNAEYCKVTTRWTLAKGVYGEEEGLSRKDPKL